MDAAHPGVGLEQVFDIPEDPRWAGVEVIRGTIRRASEEYQKKRKNRRDKAIKEWREQMSKKAAEGRREAFNFLKQADLPLCDEIAQKGTQQVIRDNEEMWGQLWMHEQGKKCEQARGFVAEHKPWARLTAEGIRFAAKAFSPTTACTDGLPPKTVAMLSEELLVCLAGMGSLWIEQAVWPSDEGTVHIALIPKPAGSERPTSLFRSIVQVVCKAAAWDGYKQGPENRRCNMEGADDVPDRHMQACR